jgi:hypothetical protein
MTDEWRKRIKADAILVRLNKHTLNRGGDLMTPGQVRAAEILLRKCLPDLKAIEVSGPGGGALLFQVEVTFV